MFLISSRFFQPYIILLLSISIVMILMISQLLTLYRGGWFWSYVPSKASYKTSVTEEMHIIIVEYPIDNVRW